MKQQYDNGLEIGQVKQCSMFNGEQILLSIKQAESLNWIDECHVFEFNFTFRGKSKPFLLSAQGTQNGIIPHRVRLRYGIDTHVISLQKKPPFIRKASDPWHNERFQRNYFQNVVDIKDEDILIFSDLDEIIDRRFGHQVVESARRYGIVTMKFWTTNYFFNLFLDGWSGPPMHSYRVFALTGKTYRTLSLSVDELRKLGEHGKLYESIHCIEEPVGFHHSWLGGLDEISAKITSYSHGLDEHHSCLRNEDGSLNKGALKSLLESKKPLFDGPSTLVQRDDIEMMISVEELRASGNEEFFV